MMLLEFKKNSAVTEKKMKSTTSTMKSAAVSGIETRERGSTRPSTGQTRAPRHLRAPVSNAGARPARSA